MTTRRELQVAAFLVRLEKVAALGAISGGIVGAGKAATKVMGETTSAVGQAARGVIGKGLIRTPLGYAAHGAAKVAPYAAAGYVANDALGNPIGKQVQLQKSRLRARAAQHRATYNPRTGVMY